MERYRGGELPANARIAIITNDALGNFVIATPLMQMVRAKYPAATIDYYGGNRIQELSQHCDLVDSSVPWLGREPRDAMMRWPEPYDWVINFEFSPWAMASAAMLAGEKGQISGPGVGPEGRGTLPFADDPQGRLAEDKEWIADDLLEKYPGLDGRHITQIFAYTSYVDGPVPPYKLPSTGPMLPIPQVLLATSASLPEKIWPLANWIAMLDHLHAKGVSAGLLGAPPKQGGKYWQGADDEAQIAAHPAVTDLRGHLTLPEVVGALGEADAVVTLDNGIMHFACATSTPTVGLFRNGIHRLWAPPVPNLTVLEPGAEGEVCDIPTQAVLDFLDQIPFDNQDY